MAAGLYLLAKSSDAFVDGAAVVARALGISPFIIGMVVIGFGTSAPELCVSALSGISNHSSLSLGNAYGSCVFNIAAILGTAALIRPLKAKASAVWLAGPLLVLVSAGSFLLLLDGDCSRTDALLLLAAFAVIMPVYCIIDQKSSGGSAAADVSAPARSMTYAAAELAVGLVLLVGSSYVLVWGAVDFARQMGVSELMIGVTIVAIGTSLPELASAVASARRGEHEFILGNIVGSNLFNMLAVVGIATMISPIAEFPKTVLWRDLASMIALSASVSVFCAGGRVGRLKGVLWLLAFLAYSAVVVFQEVR
jgi:cation:H+ antiporter